MSLVYTVDGVDRTAFTFCEELGLEPRLRYQRSAGGIGIAEVDFFNLNGTSGGWRPLPGKSLVVTDGGVTRVNSLITDVDESALTERRGGVLARVTAADQHRLPAAVTYSKSYTNQTLKQILQDLVTAKLGAYSITLDAAQANGDTFTSFECSNAYILDILNELQRITGWPWELSATLVLRMIAPASESCGFSLGDAAGIVEGNPTKRSSLSANYANAIILSIGPTAVVHVTDTFVGDAVTTQFPLSLYLAFSPGYVTVNGVSELIGTGTNWLITELAGGINGKTFRLDSQIGPRNGATISLLYPAAFPFKIRRDDTVEQGAVGYVKERLESAVDIISAYQGGLHADAILEQAVAKPAEVTVTHRSGIARVGQSIALSFASQNISGTFMVVEPEIGVNDDSQIVQTIMCIEGTTLQPTWADYFKGRGGGSSGSISGTLFGGGGGAAGVTGLPLHLGGSRELWSAPNPAVWVSAPNYTHFVARTTFVGLMRSHLWAKNAGVSATARLWDVTAGAAVMTTTSVTSQTPTERTVTGTIIAGHVYRLEVLTGTAGEPVYCPTTLEAL